MFTNDTDLDDLIRRAGAGDRGAREQLLAHHRARLRQMVAVRMDRRLLRRVDPSDVVQEALADACLRLSEYLQQRPLPFYPWLRQLAWLRLVDLHRQHVRAQKRSVLREEGQSLPLPGDSVVQLADRLLSKGLSPSGHMELNELRQRVHQALARLSPRDREVVVMRHLEQLSMAEIAAVLGITEGAVKVRHLRALQRLQEFLHSGPGEGGS
jgi:RNA polymerase sigma-70 factor (ECF subfamily)